MSIAERIKQELERGAWIEYHVDGDEYYVMLPCSPQQWLSAERHEIRAFIRANGYVVWAIYVHPDPAVIRFGPKIDES